MHRTALRVRYGETDKAGVAWHGSYIAWLEVARCELLRAHGLDYARFEEEEQLFLTVAALELKFLAPARYDEELVLETGLQSVLGASACFQQRIYCAEKLITEALVRVACVDRAGRVKPLPQRLRAVLQAADVGVGKDLGRGGVGRSPILGSDGVTS
jgi:acyl-CoA thioester hydrolase